MVPGPDVLLPEGVDVVQGPAGEVVVGGGSGGEGRDGGLVDVDGADGGGTDVVWTEEADDIAGFRVLAAGGFEEFVEDLLGPCQRDVGGAVEYPE